MHHALVALSVAVAASTAAFAGDTPVAPDHPAAPPQQQQQQSQGAPATPEQMQRELDQLRAEVRQLQADRAYSSKEAADAVASVIADADRRSQLLLSEEGSPYLGGWKSGKFTIQSADGNYVLHPWFQFQPRYVYNFRDNAKNGGDSDQQSGFEIRRMKFGVDGNVFSPDVTYLFNWATNRKTGALELEEAWLRWRFADQWAVRFGQIKDPLAHEQLMSSKMLLAADRSLLNEAFVGGDDFVQGITLAWGGEKDALQAEVGFTDGSQSANTNFQDDTNDNATAQNRADFGVAGRVQYKLMGDWKDYQDFTALNTKSDLLVVGGGGDWTQTSDLNVYLHTVDAQYESPSGLGLYAAFVGRYTDTATSGTRYDWGALGQISYLINPSLEIFGRYDYIFFDAGSVSASSDDRTVHEITAGLNYYFRAHAAKLTFDVTYLPNGTPVSADSIGVLSDPGNTEIVVRGQFQLLL
jgi:hypothetical protein